MTRHKHQTSNIKQLQLFLIVAAFNVAFNSGAFAQAQPPFVTSISRGSARTQESITLQGINFGTNASSIRVVFGAASAQPQTISDQLIEVNVPPGATHENIWVTNTSTGLSGHSGEAFFPSYGGENPFRMAAPATTTQVDFDSEDGLYDLAIADFDGDGKPDVATANDNANNISVFRNTTAGGTISFVKTILPVGARTLHVAAGDLNGDGKPEIIASQVNGSTLYVFKNTSTAPANISFTMTTFILPGSKASSIRIADLDLNGKPDLVVTDQAVSRVFVVPNQSTLATVSLSTPQSIAVPGTTGTDGVAVADLDDDGFPEIAVSEFLNANGKLFVLKNECSPGSMSFEKITTIAVPSTLSNLRIGDLDGDRKADIAGTLLLSSRVFVMGNQCTASEIKFASAVAFEADDRPWGIDFGDMDGDGKTDMVVASITAKSVTVLNNQSTAGAFSFVKTTKVTSFINRYAKIGDLDSDGRPDITFTSINDNNLGIKASKISVVRNLNCVVPKITPEGPLTICNTFTQRLEASFNEGATYSWTRDGAAIGTGATFLDVTQQGSYKVTLTSAGGTCVKESAAVVVNVIVGAPSGIAVPVAPAPVCVGGTLNLSVNDVGGTAYNWTGPGGFSATGLAVSRSNFTASQAGVYELEVKVGTCIAQREQVVVDVVSLPDAEVVYAGHDLICEGETKVLSPFPPVPGFTYQWEEETLGPISGATNATFTASVTGKYLVKLKSTASPACQPIAFPAKRIRVAKIPVVNFTSPTTGCVGQRVDFTNTTVADNDPTDPEINYAWVFGDGQSATTEHANHTYATAQNFNVGLTVSYRGNACPASKQQTIGLLVAPMVEITYAPGVFGICPDSSAVLQVNGSYTSYKWSTGATTPTIEVEQAGTYSVEVPGLGCTLTASKSVIALAETVVTATADPPSINMGDSTELSVTGLIEQVWRPSINLSDSTSATIIAVPIVTTTYMVIGIDNNACPGEAEVEVTVITDNILNLLQPASILTPNGDGINDNWTVEYIEFFDQCSVTIYNERGLMVFQATPYNNDWNGISSKGQMLPAGVYYYIIRCGEPGETPRSGSITMVR